MRKKGLTLVEVLATIGILSLLILTLMSSSIFIVKSSDEISKTNIVKSKLTYYYFETVFVPYFVSQTVYNIYEQNNLKVTYKESIRSFLEIGNGIKNRIYAANDKDIAPGLKAIEIFTSLRKKMKTDEDIKNWGIEILSVSLEISRDKPIKSVIVEKPPNSGNYEILATLIWFDVFIKYKTKDGRIVTVKTDLPLLNNVKSGGIKPSTEIKPPTEGRN